MSEGDREIKVHVEEPAQSTRTITVQVDGKPRAITAGGKPRNYAAELQAIRRKAEASALASLTDDNRREHERLKAEAKRAAIALQRFERKHGLRA